MTCAGRIARIRLMEKMDHLYQKNSNCIEKTEDGTMKYIDKKGNVMIEAKMQRRG